MDKIKEYNSLCDIQVSGHTLRAGIRTSLRAAITGGDDANPARPYMRTGGTDVIITTDKKTVVIA